MKREVYCQNCRHYKKAPKIILKNRNIEQEFACLLNKTWYFDGLNRFKDCAYYRRKWWKIWIKQWVMPVAY